MELLLIKLFKEKGDKDIDEPKYLNESVLKFPASAISSLIYESKYLFKNAVFEIVAHALSLHREDILSDDKPKKVIAKSAEDMQTNVEDLYYKKVKTIYSEIIRYATTAQSTLKLTKKQDRTIDEIKVANRKMVEIIKDVHDTNKNVSMALNSDNEYLRKEYDNLRKKVVKVIREINEFRKEVNGKDHRVKLSELKKDAKEHIRSGNKSIDRLIRKEYITAEMASSLFNDYSNVNDIIKKMIEVAELLYAEQDTLLADN